MVIVRARVRRRLARGSERGGKPRAPRVPLAEAIGRRLPAALRERAGDRTPDGADELAGRCALVAVLGGGLSGVAIGGLRAIAAVPAGSALAWRLVERIQAKRREAADLVVLARLPDVLDRLATCLLAGASLERGMRLVAASTEGRLGESLHAGLRALELGMPRARAYETIARHAQIEEAGRALTALARAERLGTPVASVLSEHAREIRARLRAAAEAEARTAPVRMLFPTAICFLPAFMLLTIAPVALSALSTVRGI
jgi:tight adherence protein C